MRAQEIPDNARSSGIEVETEESGKGSHRAYEPIHRLDGIV